MTTTALGLRTRRLSAHATGLALALVTATVSGVAVWTNAHAVSHFDDATVYTTAKNAVAGALLAVLALTVPLAVPRDGRVRSARPATRLGWLGLAALAVGGSVPFVLFFEGLARASATQAAFIHKTLFVWVALLAVPLLRERIGRLQVAAIGLLLAGQAVAAGSAGTIAFGSGEAMILAATLFWAAEVVVAKRLLASLRPGTLAVARMAAGTVVLVGWLAVTGRGGDVLALSADQWTWALATGLLLTAYVATWLTALAHAPAVDVTAVLVFGAVVTALLARAFDGAAPDPGGLVLIAAGTLVAGAALLRRPRQEAAPA